MEMHINLRRLKRKSDESKSYRQRKWGHRSDGTDSQSFNEKEIPITMDSLTSSYRIRVKHVCTMTPDPDPVIMAITEGYFVQFRRTFRKLFLASKGNPCTHLYLKSSTAILKEWRRHLRHHYYMIHPFSIFSSYWSAFMVFVNIGIMVVSPISYLQYSATFYKVQQWQDVSIFSSKVFKLTFVYIVFLLWTACESARLDLNMFPSKRIEYLQRQSMIYIVIRKLSRCLTTMLLIQADSADSYRGQYSAFQFIDLLNLTVGYFLRFVMYGFIMQLIQMYNTARDKYVLLTQQLSDYCHFKMLPDFIRKRIFHYFQFRYQKNFLKEDDIWSMLSDQLKQEVTMNCCKRLVEGVVFFKPLPLNMLVKIVKCLKRDFFLPNDVIVTAGTPGDNMYFLATGTVAVYLKTGKEVCHLTDGEHFGEIALVLTIDRTSSVVALEPCEIYTLSRKDFHKVIGVHPSLLDRVTTLAEDRLQATAIMLHNAGIHELCNCSLASNSLTLNIHENVTSVKESAFVAT